MKGNDYAAAKTSANAAVEKATKAKSRLAPAPTAKKKKS